tara:strand:- start:2775 stop:2975 length:201 start_codon:yes stop_codon:yes gene_type:complete
LLPIEQKSAKKYQQLPYWLRPMINENLVEILLAAILVSNTYDKDQPVIKWGGIVIAVAGIASALLG